MSPKGTPVNRGRKPKHASPKTRRSKTPRRLFNNSPRSSLTSSPLSGIERQVEPNCTPQAMKKIIYDAFEKFGLSPNSETNENSQSKKKSKQQNRCFQRRIRDAVKSIEESDEGLIFNLQSRFDGAQNQRVLCEVYRVLRNNGKEEVDRLQTSRALRRFFLSKKRMARLTRTEKKAEFLQKQRKRQRMTSKRQKRLKALHTMKNSNFSDRDRKYLQASLEDNSYISSENSDYSSGEEEEEGEKKKRLVKVPLPWRSDFLNDNFKKLDKYWLKRAKSVPVYERFIDNEPSHRNCPEDAPSWAVKEQ